MILFFEKQKVRKKPKSNFSNDKQKNTFLKMKMKENKKIKLKITIL